MSDVGPSSSRVCCRRYSESARDTREEAFGQGSPRRSESSPCYSSCSNSCSTESEGIPLPLRCNFVFSSLPAKVERESVEVSDKNGASNSLDGIEEARGRNSLIINTVRERSSSGKRLVERLTETRTYAIPILARSAVTKQNTPTTKAADMINATL